MGNDSYILHQLLNHIALELTLSKIVWISQLICNFLNQHDIDIIYLKFIKVERSRIAKMKN